VKREEIDPVVSVMENGWLGSGKKCREFERKVSYYLGKKDGVFVNSGSSANLLAIAAAKKYFKLQDGDEIIVTACGFPTTINPIFQNNLVPVFVDINLKDYNVDFVEMMKAISDKTKGIMIAHSFGIPCYMDEIINIAKQYNLFIIEDCCDALTSKYDDEYVGSFGDFCTTSFYPSHILSTGGGGIVCGKTKEQNDLLRSLANWGRACNCFGIKGTEMNGLCGKRFSKWLNGFDEIYDHKYLYNNIGYCLENNEIHAAIGLERLKRLEYIAKQRKANYNYLLNKLEPECKDVFNFVDELVISDITPFCFPLTIKKDSKFKRSDIVEFLEFNGIQTRQFFGGNMLLHNIYDKSKYKVIGNLENSTYVTFNTFFVGVWEESSISDIDFVAEKILEFVKWRIE
jgi:CDP-6-deoxy-D-xylo-4-hexulose-3-dehydrase